MPYHRDMLHRCGFTLIELLVVISLTAMLVALLLPALQSARGASQVVQTLSNLRQIQIAVHSYAGDNHDYLPHSDGTPYNGTLGTPTLFPFWPGRLVSRGYLSDPLIFWGPMRSTQWIGGGYFVGEAVMRTNASANSYQYPGFAVNTSVMVSRLSTISVSHRLGTPYAVHTDAINQNPSDSDILIMTEFYDAGAFFGSWAPDGYWRAKHSDDSWLRPFTYRGASASAYVDGHAGSEDSISIGWIATGDREGAWHPASHNYWARQQPWFRKL